MIFEVMQKGGRTYVRADQVSRIVHAPPSGGHSAGSLVFMLDGRFEAVEERTESLVPKWRAALVEWRTAGVPEWAPALMGEA